MKNQGMRTMCQKETWRKEVMIMVHAELFMAKLMLVCSHDSKNYSKQITRDHYED